jgi:hypothetical protein
LKIKIGHLCTFVFDVVGLEFELKKKEKGMSCQDKVKAVQLHHEMDHVFDLKVFSDNKVDALLVRHQKSKDHHDITNNGFVFLVVHHNLKNLGQVVEFRLKKLEHKFAVSEEDAEAFENLLDQLNR